MVYFGMSFPMLVLELYVPGPGVGDRFDPARIDVPKPKRGDTFCRFSKRGLYCPGPGITAPPLPSLWADPNFVRGPRVNFELLSGPAGVYAPGPGVWVTVSLACFPRKVHFGDFF
jgi:hypothetical protein